MVVGITWRGYPVMRPVGRCPHLCEHCGAPGKPDESLSRAGGLQGPPAPFIALPCFEHARIPFASTPWQGIDPLGTTPSPAKLEQS